MPRCCSSSIQSEVADRRSPCGLDRAGLAAERAAVEQELLGERGLARVGVGDDGEGPAPGRLGTGSAGVLTRSANRLRRRDANGARRSGSSRSADAGVDAAQQAGGAGVAGQAEVHLVHDVADPAMSRSGSASPTEPPAP